MNTGWRLRRRGSFLLALVLGLVVLADWLFYGQPIGWTASLFGLALLLALALRSSALLPGGRGKPGRVVAGATLGLIAALVIHPGVLPVTLGLLGLITLAAIDRGGWTSSVVLWGKRWAVFLGKAAVQLGRDTWLQNRWRRSHHGGQAGFLDSGRAGLGSVRAWVIPVGLSVVFVGLFAVANPVVQRGVSRAWDAVNMRITGLSEWLSLGRMAMWIVTAVAVWGLLRVRLRSTSSPSTPGVNPDGKAVRQLDRVTGTSLVVRCLILFNAVFAVQTLLDARYLYGGAALPDGMTYAEYAQRGAYPLVATALLAGLFVLLTFRPNGPAQRSAWCRRLVGLWVAQNIVLMASAAWRLNLYVEVYSLTRWRVAAAIWMLLVAVGFAWLIWRIVADRGNGWLLQRVTLSAALVLYGVCFVDVDRHIADYNVARCAEVGGGGQPIDLAYLDTLGPAALPATQRLLEQWDPDAVVPAVEPQRKLYARGPADDWHGSYSASRWTAQEATAPYRPADAEALAQRLERELNRDLSGWRGWTWRRAQWAQPTLALSR
ncbi:MAG: DUF4173 domain-containing protein [Planctomycetota bacterium]